MRHTHAILLACAATAVAGRAQHDTARGKDQPMFVAPASSEGRDQIQQFKLAKDLVCDLVAAEPDLCNVVAFHIDAKGRLFVAETFRINDGVFDTRSYMQWKDEDLALRTVPERVAKYHKHIAKDLPKYAGYSERVRLLVDTNRDGVYDRSTVFADGFTDLADGIASGVLAVGEDVYFTNIPKLWRLRDRNGDGVADERTVLHDGYGVHTSLIGHDLHGLCLGPDRRLYFSIGDRGLHVVQGERTFDLPHEGAVLRCELDGSQLEVVHRGLRNPQELAFDHFGDLFTGDNNSDGGDRARFVQILLGADSGWRIGYQWLSDRGAWNREKLWEPRHPGQPAWVFPPIVNLGDGPSGLVHDLGQGLPERWRDCFFLCDFRGGPSYSGVRALRLQRRGAGHELLSEDQPIWGVLATDVDFGPDGSLYVSDWVNGWNKTGKGRLYRVRTAAMANDMALRNTATLLAADLRERSAASLRSLLAHPDRRVRQAAQFALVDQNERAVLWEVAKSGDTRLERLHAIWGLGILGRSDGQALDGMAELLRDGDADVRAMAARVLGDAKLRTADQVLRAALKDGNSRVQREAALALAQLGELPDAVLPLVDLLARNDDHDHVLRHAAAFALARCGSPEAIAKQAQDPRRAVRLGVLLALAHRADARVAAFLSDAEPTLRFEAARAIHGVPIPDAMPALAALANDDTAEAEALDWRVLSANRLLGSVEHGEALVHIASAQNHPKATRREAIEILAEWPNPHGQDRVDGNWRPCQHPKAEVVTAAFAAALPALLADRAVAEVAAKAAGRLRTTAAGPALAALVGDTGHSVAARTAALDALDAMAAGELEAALDAIPADAPVPLRKRAIELLSRTKAEKAVPVLASLLANAPVAEQQAALVALGGLRHLAAADLLVQWLERLARNEVPAALQLELLEAAAAHDDPRLRAALAARGTGEAAGGALAPFAVCLEGGDAKAGRTVFFDHEATRCTRCHTLGGKGGNAGPVLDGIGGKHAREYLLRALVTPSSEIAAGFGAVTLELTGDRQLVGVVTKDQDGMVTVVGPTGEATEVPVRDVLKRTPNAQSAMPAMGGSLTKRQLRDLLAFLAGQK